MRKGEDHTCAGPVQLSPSSIGVRLGIQVQYRSSGILAMIPSFNNSPSTRFMSSSRAVLEPSMPMADHAYTCTPRNGVVTLQYFMESHGRGIWYNVLVKSAAMMCFHCAIRRNVESASGISDGWGLL